MFTSLGHNPFFQNIHGNVALDGLMLLLGYFPHRYCRAVLECYPHQYCLSFLGPDGVGFHHLNFKKEDSKYFFLWRSLTHSGLFKVNLEFTISGVTWKMKYQFVLETGNWKPEFWNPGLKTQILGCWAKKQ